MMNPRLTLLAACLLALAVAVPGVAMAKPKHPHKSPLVPKTGEYTGTETVLGESEAIRGEVLKSAGKFQVLLVAEAIGKCTDGTDLTLTLNSAAVIKEGKFKAVVKSPDPMLATEVTVTLAGHFKSPTQLIGTAASATKAEAADPTSKECSTGTIKFTLKKG